ncbi:MAG: CatB-related O-acetyltransferase [Planctomycetota bacterium]
MRRLGKWEGNRMHSHTLRVLIEKYHGVRVGAYSYGPCLKPGQFPRGVVVGRYASIADGVRVFLRNHPMDWLSTHAFFFNRVLGYVPRDTVEPGELWIGHDAWIGENSIITPGCSRIGIGSVVGAGSVVTRDVPDFAIVAGTPAKQIRYRFPEATRQAILASRWWERPMSEVRGYMDSMTAPVPENPERHPLLSGSVGPEAG